MTDKPEKPPAAPKRKGTSTRGQGTPKGEASIPGGDGGFIGNPRYEPTEEQRAKVRSLARAFPDHGENSICALMGFSRQTLRTYFEADLALGRAELVAQCAAQIIIKATRGDDAKDEAGNLLAPGNLDALKFILSRRGGWTTKVDVEMSGRGGRPIESIDLSRLNTEQLELYGRLAAIAEGLDPQELLGGNTVQ